MQQKPDIFADLLASLTEARKRCGCGCSFTATRKVLAIAERSIALIEDYRMSGVDSGSGAANTIALLESLAHSVVFEFSSDPCDLGPVLPSSLMSPSLKELTESVNRDYSAAQQSRILSGLYRVQGKSTVSSVSAGPRVARSSSSSFSSFTASAATASTARAAAAAAVALPSRSTSGIAATAADRSDDIEPNALRTQSNDFDEFLHIGANGPAATAGVNNSVSEKTQSITKAFGVDNDDNDDGGSSVCFTQVPLPQFPQAQTDEEAERIITSTLETRPSVAVCEALVKQVLVGRILALTGSTPPSRSLCASLFAVYDAYPNVVLGAVLEPMIRKGLSGAQANVLEKFAVHTKLSPGVVRWLAECLCVSPCGASELAVGLFQSFVGLQEWSQLGSTELYAVAKWLQHAEPALRKSIKFASFLLALLKKHSVAATSAAAAAASTTAAVSTSSSAVMGSQSIGKAVSDSQGNDAYMSVLRELAKTNESMLKRTLIKFL